MSKRTGRILVGLAVILAGVLGTTPASAAPSEMGTAPTLATAAELATSNEGHVSPANAKDQESTILLTVLPCAQDQGEMPRLDLSRAFDQTIVVPPVRWTMDKGGVFKGEYQTRESYWVADITTTHCVATSFTIAVVAHHKRHLALSLKGFGVRLGQSALVLAGELPTQVACVTWNGKAVTVDDGAYYAEVGQGVGVLTFALFAGLEKKIEVDTRSAKLGDLIRRDITLEEVLSPPNIGSNDLYKCPR